MIALFPARNRRELDLNAAHHKTPRAKYSHQRTDRRAAVVGDSLYDIMTVQTAGVRTIAVSFGLLLWPLEKPGAAAVLGHFDALSEPLSGWRGLAESKAWAQR